ncbi:uncharacterized protein [Drosophila bipectinata]|uniref:uncharacterized protein isoform X5 n=1 Tax=Drosophila bipectinata TaxID=42026 RepID=UPI0038B337EC
MLVHPRRLTCAEPNSSARQPVRPGKENLESWQETWIDKRPRRIIKLEYHGPPCNWNRLNCV